MNSVLFLCGSPPHHVRQQERSQEAARTRRQPFRYEAAGPEPERMAVSPIVEPSCDVILYGDETLAISHRSLRRWSGKEESP